MFGLTVTGQPSSRPAGRVVPAKILAGAPESSVTFFDAQESLLTELSVEAAKRGLILLVVKVLDGSRVRRGLGGVLPSALGTKPHREEVGDAVNDEGAVRGGLIHGEHVVGFGCAWGHRHSWGRFGWSVQMS